MDAATKSPQSSVWLITKAARSLLASLAFGHLTEPIWLPLLIVALPDLATPIAKSFGTIEIRRTIAGLKSPTGDLRGKRAGDKCRLSLVRGAGGGGETLQTIQLERELVAGKSYFKTLLLSRVAEKCGTRDGEGLVV